MSSVKPPIFRLRVGVDTIITNLTSFSINYINENLSFQLYTLDKLFILLDICLTIVSRISVFNSRFWGYTQ